MNLTVNALEDVAVTIQPLGDLILVRVLEEENDVGGILLPKSTTKYEGRSLQGEILAVGIHVREPELLAAHGQTVLFDDGAAEDARDVVWWQGSLLPNYLGAVLGEGDEYALVPAGQILTFVEHDGRDEG